MNIRRIEVFLAVVEAGSFTAAAQRLHIVQSAVSTTIRDLEDELSTALFVRNRRPLQLTPAGRMLFVRAAPALKNLQAAHREVRDLQALKGRRLSIASTPLVTQVALARLFADFLRQHPDLQLKLTQAGSLEIESLVLKGEADIGILAVRALHADLETRHVWNVASTACFAVDSPISRLESIGWREFFSLPLAVFPPGYHLREVCERHADRAGCRLSIAVETSSFSVMLEAVRSGIAASLLPVHAIANQSGVVAVPLSDIGAEQLGLIGCWRRGEALGEPGESLLKFLISNRAVVYPLADGVSNVTKST